MGPGDRGLWLEIELTVLSRVYSLQQAIIMRSLNLKNGLILPIGKIKISGRVKTGTNQ